MTQPDDIQSKIDRLERELLDRGALQMAPERRRELLGSTDLGRATLEQEDKAVRARGDAPKGTTMPDATRARLLGGSSIGRAILDAEKAKP